MDKITKPYKTTNQTPILADIYCNSSDCPVILYLHGGGLIFGSRTNLPKEQLEFWLTNGFTVISADYRLAPETKLEGIVEDIVDLLQWIRGEAAAEFRYDASRLAIIGSSAGAYLAMLTGTMEVRPNAIVSFYGYGDISGPWLSQPSEHYVKTKPLIGHPERYVGNAEVSEGGWDRFNYYLYCRQQGNWALATADVLTEEDQRRLQRYQTIDLVDAAYPPVMLLHGNCDNDVPYEQSVMLHNRFKEFGISSELITIAGADHVFDHQFHQPVVQEAFREVLSFLQLHVCK